MGIIMKEQWPCKVTAFSTAKPGKHGSAKAMITAKDIFTDKQYDETFGTGDMIPEGELKEDLNFPTEAHLSELRGKIITIVDAGEKECLVQIQKYGDREQIVAVREGQDM